MYQSLLSDTSFHDRLLELDRELAEQARRAGCGKCRGVLHSAKYWRKPRGRACRVSPDHDQRFSFCCARDGCRSRTTPPSLRFLGRKVYLATIVVLVSMMRHGVTDGRLARLNEVIDVDRRTVMRWLQWWRDAFTATAFWRNARAAFSPPVDEDSLPATLLERFHGKVSERLMALLRFITPITGGKAHAF